MQPIDILSSPTFLPIFITTVLILVQLLTASKLSHIPGPFIGRFTDAWRLFNSWKYLWRAHILIERLRRDYGDVVRIGPNNVVVFDPAAIPTIYGTHVKLNKGAGYDAWKSTNSSQSLLTTHDHGEHQARRRPVAGAYALSSLKQYEPYVDEMVQKVVDHLEKKAMTGDALNLSKLLHYYAYDTVGKLTLGKAIGFLDEQRDVHGLMDIQKRGSTYAALFSQMPWLNRLLKSPLFSYLIPAGTGGVIKFVAATVQARLQAPDDPSQPKPDLLAHFVQAHLKYPEVITDRQVMMNSAGNLFAGSQSPSRSLDAICRYVAVDPTIQDRLREEIEAAGASYPVPLDRALNLPYLDAVIREGHRMSESSLFVLERVAPEGGLVLPKGIRIPAGTIIGIPTSGMNWRRDIFGRDADRFNPDRWLRAAGESEDAYKGRRATMERSDMMFGQGSRACIGKNITTLELSKVVASVFGLFKFYPVTASRRGEVNVNVERRSSLAALG